MHAAVDFAEEENVPLNLRNKLITASLALVVSLGLAASFAGVDTAAPKASLLGFVVQPALWCASPGRVNRLQRTVREIQRSSSAMSKSVTRSAIARESILTITALVRTPHQAPADAVARVANSRKRHSGCDSNRRFETLRSTRASRETLGWTVILRSQPGDAWPRV